MAQENKTPVQWKVLTHSWLREIASNNVMAYQRPAFQIFGNLLGQVAQRASELNDPVLNGLMARLALYEATDPTSEHYDKQLTEKLILEAENHEAQNKRTSSKENH